MALLWLIVVAVGLAPILVGWLAESIRPAMRRAHRGLLSSRRRRRSRALNRCSSRSGSEGG